MEISIVNWSFNITDAYKEGGGRFENDQKLACVICERSLIRLNFTLLRLKLIYYEALLCPYVKVGGLWRALTSKRCQR